MKPLFILAGLIACSFAFAQQPPAASAGAQPGVSVLRPEYATPNAGPVDARIADSPVTWHELRELLRAQTEAIRVLSVKVDSLEDRLRRIEAKLR